MLSNKVTFQKSVITILIFCLSSGLGVMLFFQPTQVEFFFLDLQYKFTYLFSNPQKVSEDVIVVLIDRATEQKLKIRQGPFFREYHTQIIGKLKAAGVKVIGFDIAFQTAYRQADEKFALAIKSSGNVIAGEIAEQQANRLLRGSFKAVGSIYTEDYWDIPRQIYDDPNRAGLKAFAIEIVNAFRAGQKAASQQIAQRRIGDNFWINYRYPPGYFPLFSYPDILEAGQERLADPRHTPWGFLKNKIVLIGYSQEQFSFPGFGGSQLPGLYVHAYAIENLLQGSTLQRINFFSNLMILLMTIAIIQYTCLSKVKFLKLGGPCLWLVLLFACQFFILVVYNAWLSYASLFLSSICCLTLNHLVVRFRNVRAIRGLHHKLKEFEQFKTNIEESLVLKEMLTDMVFHDLKNYVYSIDTGVKLLAESCRVDSSLNKKVGVIRIACRGIESLLKNLLEVKQLEEGKLKINKEFFELARVRELAGALGSDPLCEVKKLGVIIEANPEHAEIYADIYLLERMLHNLFNNAFKYSIPGGEVRFACLEQADEMILSLFNSSIPLTAAQQDLVFDKYYQAEKSAAYSKGLGLYFCRQVMLAHGGRIWIESSAKGNYFFLAFKKK